MRFFLILLLIVLLAGAAATYLLVTPYGPQAARLVTIPSGSSAESIGKILKRNGIVRSRWLFAATARVRRGTLKAGVYRFDHPAPLLAVYDRVRAGDIFTIALTIPEGFNIFDIAAAAEKAGLATRQDFLAAEQHDTDLIQDLSANAPSLEGYLFPDTYKDEKIQYKLVTSEEADVSKGLISTTSPIGRTGGARDAGRRGSPAGRQRIC